MSTTFSAASPNAFIEALEPVFDNVEKPVETIVIADMDEKLLRSLSHALGDRPAAVLGVSSDRWDLQDRQFSEMVEWALQQSDIQSLVLAGNPGVNIAAHDSSSEGGYAGKLKDAQERNAGRRASQEQLASCLQQLSGIPVIHDRWSNGELAVFGLFYLSETGFFLTCNAGSSVFRPARW